MASVKASESAASVQQDAAAMSAAATPFHVIDVASTAAAVSTPDLLTVHQQQQAQIAALQKQLELLTSLAWALLAMLGAGILAVGTMNLYYGSHLWLTIVFMVLGLTAAVAGSFKYSSRSYRLLVFSLLFGLALGVALGHLWLTAFYAAD